MEIKSLDELREVDERTLAFAPLEMALSGQMRPEDAALYQQEVISHAELVTAVGEHTHPGSPSDLERRQTRECPP